ncbi:MAG: hypothetical protein K2K00_02290 [Muribaculaceae bacterium]|nr:hypothetical protein [Muribaculaceae bacterium]
MKKIFALAVIAASFMMTSCGSNKNTASAADYQYYKQQQQQQQAQAEQRPTRTLRQKCESERLATEDCDKWRALGTSTSYVEKVARNEAARDARNQLAQMMKVAVEGAAQDYEQNAQKNMKSSAASLGEAVMSQFVAEEVENTKIIASDVFDLSDGSVQVYVCIEIRDNKDNFAKKLNNTLERDGLIEIQYDRDRFIEKMAAGLEEYKKKHAN